MDAIEKPAEAKPPVEEVVRTFLEDMKAAVLQRFPAVGKGEQLRLGTDSLAGSALHAQEHVVHLCVFRVDRETAPRRRPEREP
jgi:hypothetical protein